MTPPHYAFISHTHVACNYQGNKHPHFTQYWPHNEISLPLTLFTDVYTLIEFKQAVISLGLTMEISFVFTSNREWR
jgi:hypothetical protein